MRAPIKTVAAAEAVPVPPAEPRLLTRPEAARQLGISVAYLKYLDARGKGPARFEFGRRIVYSPADLRAFANKHRRAAGEVGDGLA